jgi:hypothetical protein
MAVQNENARNGSKSAIQFFRRLLCEAVQAFGLALMLAAGT